MGTHIIIDARTRTARAGFDAPDEGTTIFAIDLVGDTWDDFKYFAEQARVSERIGDLTKRNRYVRSATAALFSHLEGIVSDIYSKLRKDSSFASYQPRNPDYCSLKDKVEAVHKFLVEHRALSSPPPPLELKLLRDIVNHPTITKKTSEPGSRETVFLDGSDVYGIAVEDLDTTGDEISHWLDAVCVSATYDRFLDTKRLAEEFAAALGDEAPSTRRF